MSLICSPFPARSGSDHPNWTSPLTCRSTSAPRRRLSCKQFQLDQNPGRHFIQPRRLHNSVGSPEVLLCIDMEKILHRPGNITFRINAFRQMCHISKTCHRYVNPTTCKMSILGFEFDLYSALTFFTFPSPPCKKEAGGKKNGELLDWRFFLGRSSSSPTLLSLLLLHHHLHLN